MENFWDFSVWGFINIVCILLISLLVANFLKETIKPLKKSLIPTSVLGGLILLIIAVIYKAITKNNMFNTSFFGNNGSIVLEIITYHSLALGFIASSFKISERKLTKKRSREIFDSGCTTVATYLIQGILGLGITIIATFFITDFFKAAGVLLPFGYGQGTGQALNYGGIYESEYGFEGGRSFGLSIAALGFLSASIGGVIHLNILRRKGRINTIDAKESKLDVKDIEDDGEIPLNKGIDKFTIQLMLIALSYFLSYLLMLGLGLALPGVKAVIYGFNFFIGVLVTTLIKLLMKLLKKKNILKHQYTNNFLLTRISNFFFDLMIVSGIAAIQIEVLTKYWLILIILGVVGLVFTYLYNVFVANVLFKEYKDEQFIAMYGMLTGTASTGIILLRELDGDFLTPAADNLVYQTFPAMVFGFPMMLLATLAPKKPELTLLILVIFFIVMNIILFRNIIFSRFRKKKEQAC